MKDMVVELLNLVSQFGYIGIALALMIEVIPSELVLAYGGYLVSSGDFNFYGIVLAGLIGGVIAQLFLYWIGYYGGRPFLDKFGKYLLLSKHHLELSERWFEKYGTGVIFFARFIPLVRHAISVPAGISKMSLSRFLTFTTLAILPWSFIFIYLGEKLGRNWENIQTVAAPYVDLSIVVIVAVACVFLIWKYLRRFKP
ncbi:DedA family protein [Pullulanibacillus sp. KACC 23026]|uniref:DedA family protein n=1 Tax=Pullulanibacillus sp. KACC 23026 TaxID=3028315 RepID=UPI0023AECD69|nr:DedA family protein [Pullulanibacillus sp. KACC 23026]WEG10880.1 DedA family protein [Pullulanibacillus sp. KACC 23026]